MIRQTLLLLFLIGNLNTFAHYAQSAEFTFNQKGKQLEVIMEFAKDHLLDNFRINTLTEEKIKHYVLAHFQCKVNEQETTYQFLNVNTASHHVRVHIVLKGTFPTISSVYVMNSCLLEYHSEHINIIHFNLNDRFRSFRTDSQRKSITAKY